MFLTKLIVRAALLLIVAGISLASAVLAQNPRVAGVDRKALDRECHDRFNGEGYKKINWQENMQKAVEKAQADKKPILAFMYVRRADQPSTEC